MIITDGIEELNGADWGSDNSILFGQSAGIFRVSANGGTPELVIPAHDGETLSSHGLLPDGDTVLMTVMNGYDWDTGEIVATSLSTGERTVLIRGGSDAMYLPTGHIVYALGSDLYAQAFDLDTLTVSGGPVSVVQGLNRATRSDSANYAVSACMTYPPTAGDFS